MMPSPGSVRLPSERGFPRPRPLGRFVSPDAGAAAKSRKSPRSPAPGELARDFAGAVRDATAPYAEEYAAQQCRAQKAEGKAMKKAEVPEGHAAGRSARRSLPRCTACCLEMSGVVPSICWSP